ncbi:hypothetical protein GW17_00001086 [Ensete ventricosum]|nr:hypothetical protein GW17_00001086 [Ensete ventricosum]
MINRQCTGIKGHPRGNYEGGYLVPILKREKTSTSKREILDCTPRGNANLAIRGISLGTHHPGEDLSLQEQLHGVKKKTRIKATTRTKHSNTPSLDSTSRWAPACTYRPSPHCNDSDTMEHPATLRLTNASIVVIGTR